MAIHFTPEQEQRIQAVIGRGAYESVDEVVEAALVAVEQRTMPGFDGTGDELESLLVEGLASKELTEDEFWESVNKRTDAMLAAPRSDSRL
jgi:Arc/MetJ-type ribon-helix-helix transcriptional regulator